MSNAKYETDVGGTVEPVMDRISNWPCKVERVMRHGQKTVSMVATMTLPYVDQVFRVLLDGDGELCGDPKPDGPIVWYRVIGTDDCDHVVESYLCREHAVNRAESLDDPEVFTYHDDVVVKQEDASDFNQLAAAES